MSAVSGFWAHTVARLNRIKLAIAMIALAFFGLSANAAMAAVEATFTTGAIAEYSGPNGNQNDNVRSFAQLGITKIVMSQTGATWGGTQGNDLAVTMTITFNDTTTYSFAAALNWQLNDGGSAIPVDYFGVTAPSTIADADDRYVRSNGTLNKTYILVLPSKVASSNFAGLLSTDATDGSANLNEQAIFTALNIEFPVDPVITGPSGGAGAAASAVSVNENQTGATQLSANEAVTWSITGGVDQSKFQIATDGTITFLTAPDFEVPTDSDQNNTYVLTVTATKASNNVATQTVTVTVLNLDDLAPVITGPSGGAGAAASAVSVNENQTGATQLSANEAVTWSITGGVDQSKFQIATDGTITFLTAPDFEGPTDSDANNTYVLIVTATDASNNVATQTVTVTVLDLADSAPVITGPSGGAGAAASAVSVNENQTGATQLSANEAVTWSITGGVDQNKFQIANDGTITFLTAPDFEAPTDSDANNTYILTVTATNVSSNVATQTVIVTVLNLDDAAPVITGPSGGAGAAASAVSVNENQTGATQLSANEAVTWSITGGVDQSKFQIASNGAITFRTAPDFEVPTDSNANNTYVLIVTATDARGNISTQTVTVTVLNVDDTPPTISGPSGGPGDPRAEITVNEGQTAVTKLTASEGVVWNISSGNDAGKFQIASDGTITFVAAPDYENPTDGGTNNTYILTVTATDPFGNVSTQTITVNIANLDDTAPVITGPSGGAGAAESAISVNENQTAVTRVTANEAVIWTINGGSESAKFQIAADGTITFTAAPDYERPTDADTNNTYVLIIKATDSAGNQSSQTMTVTVVDLDDSAPVITGPSGGAGAAASAITVNEGLTAVTTFAANERVTWSILSGDDTSGFTIDPATGAISFRAAQDYENPTDADRNNSHIVRIRAVDAAGNESIQTLTVTIANVDEIARKIAEISGRLRGGLRNYAMHSLGDMLSFNEGLMQGADDNDRDCGNVQQNKALSGSVNGNEANQQANVAYAKDVSQCGRPYRVLLNTSLAVSRFASDWNSRALGSIRVERKVGSDIVLGVGIMSSTSKDKLASFGDSEISDTSLQLNVYGRARLAEKLRGGAFWGIGKSWYEFELRDGGLDLNGKMSGNRSVYGAMLSGDVVVKGVTITTDAILSRAVEHLGDAKLAATYLGEKRSGIAFAVGSVDTTRLSVPVTGQFVLSDTQANNGRVTKLLLSPGLLCEDTSVDASAMDCGYQLGAKLNSRLSNRGTAYFDYKLESVSGLRRNLFGIGYAHQFGAQNAVEVAFDVNHGVSEMTGSDNRAMVRVRLVR